MIAISLAFDGGEKKYSRDLDDLGRDIKNYRTLFQAFINWFETGDTQLPALPPEESPMLKIWKSQGELIGGKWSNKSEAYTKWKNKNWQKSRLFPVPISRNNLQVLSGRTLSGLLNSQTEGAVRKVGSTTLEYGIENDYSKKWQEERKILDFYPGMARSMDRILASWIYNLNKGVITDD